MTVLSCFCISIPYLVIMIFKITVFFLQNSFPIKIDMLSQTTHNKGLSFSGADIALIVPSDANAIEPVACFANRKWEYALVSTSYNSKWEYQRT